MEALAPLCSLKLECEKLVSEKTEMQRHYVMVSCPCRVPLPPPKGWSPWAAALREIRVLGLLSATHPKGPLPCPVLTLGPGRCEGGRG